MARKTRMAPARPYIFAVPRPAPLGMVEIGGLKLNIVSEADTERADMVVCMLEGFDSPFDDNLVGPCAQCGRRVIFRPSAPKRPPKVCLECAVPLAAPAQGNA